MNRLKIAMLSGNSANDRRAWSGTEYSIRCAVEQFCGDLLAVPAIYSKKRLIPRIINAVSRRLGVGTFNGGFCHLQSLSHAASVRRVMASHKPDVIFAASAYSLLAHYNPEVPVVYYSDVIVPLLRPLYLEWQQMSRWSIAEATSIERMALRKADAVVFASSWAAEAAIQHYSLEPSVVSVIPFGANLIKTSENASLVENNLIGRCHLLFLGVDWVRKGGDIAVETVQMLNDLGVDADLTICGCEPPPAVAAVPRIRVIPFLDKSKPDDEQVLCDLLREAHFLILPTRADCFGIVFCEAAAFGLPSIATSVGGVAEAVREGISGHLLPLEASGKQYAELIAQLYRNEERYHSLCSTSRCLFEKTLNWKTWGRDMDKVFQSVTS